MKILFIHQNFPGQYPHLAGHFGRDPDNQVIALGDQQNVARANAIPGVRILGYPTPKGASASTHPYVRPHEAAVRRGQAVARALMTIRKQGFIPDVVCAHPGWGEALFVKDVFPDSRLVCYAEFYYRSIGSDVGFDPEFPATLDDHLRVRIKNSTMALSMLAADAAVSPTKWQMAQYPDELKSKISVIHDGVDTDLVSPGDSACVALPDGTVLTSADPVLTFVARNLEPYRGFHVFMRALPAILERLPEIRVLIVGGDDVSYGRRQAEGMTYRQALLKEVENVLDQRRVHFLGRLSYSQYLSVLRISRAHVYLTYPFVMSWSLLEAMSAGCLVIGSNTPPVAEVIENQQNGLLTDFFDREGLADRVIQAMTRPDDYRQQRAAARRTVVARLDLKRICLPQHVALIESLANRRHRAKVSVDEFQPPVRDSLCP